MRFTAVAIGLTTTALLGLTAVTPVLGKSATPCLVVYVSNEAEVDREVQRKAVALAEVIFANAGVKTQWRIAPKTGSAAFEDGSIHIRLLHGPVNEDSVSSRALASAMMREGKQVRVYWNRVQRHTETSFVLAYVMAHEITHLLQGVARHAKTGIMKAYWEWEDFEAMQGNAVQMRPVRPLLFEREDLALIREGLRQRLVR